MLSLVACPIGYGLPSDGEVFASFCGDGFKAPDEECDDGNTDEQDECTNTCTVATCGDGIVGPNETCDDGNLDDTDECPTTCEAAACGDGFIRQGVEECDDGDVSDDDATCSSQCTVPACGDGLVSAGEACDDGNADDTDACLSTCEMASCGDDFVHAGVEECDDGNADDTDACPTTCSLAFCGDGFVQVGIETCDGGVNVDGEVVDCREDCTYCGDGRKDLGLEACDDGNAESTDSCTPLCELVRRRVFVTDFSLYTGNLGGVTGADQACRDAAGSGSLENPETFKAWLSSTTFDAQSRLENGFLGLYVLVSDPEIVVAQGWNDLTDDTLEHAIDRNEYGLQEDVYVWTSTDTTGVAWTGDDCAGYKSSSNSYSGGVGYSRRNDYRWTTYGTTACSTSKALYCFEDRL